MKKAQSATPKKATAAAAGAKKVVAAVSAGSTFSAAVAKVIEPEVRNHSMEFISA
jgi:hypothetical protein